jgi:hypothetical protein
MNIGLLKLTQRNLSGWLNKCYEETVPTDRKLEVIMMSLSDICIALGTDGSQEAIEEWYNHD